MENADLLKESNFCECRMLSNNILCKLSVRAEYPSLRSALGKRGISSSVTPPPIHQYNFGPLLYTEIYKNLNCICIAQCLATLSSLVCNLVKSSSICISSTFSFCFSPIGPRTMGTTTAESICLHFDYIFSILLPFFFF